MAAVSPSHRRTSNCVGSRIYASSDLDGIQQIPYSYFPVRISTNVFLRIDSLCTTRLTFTMFVRKIAASQFRSENFTVQTFTSTNSFAPYYIHVTQAVSGNYALFCATALRYPLYSQCFPHSFHRDGGGTPCSLLQALFSAAI
jgi:hypothetical protein